MKEQPQGSKVAQENLPHENQILLFTVVAWICVILGGAAVGPGLLAFFCGSTTQPDQTSTLGNLASLGSYLQGAVQSLWSLAAFLFIYVAFLGQKQQIKLQGRQFEIEQRRQEADLKQQQNELEAQRVQFQLQHDSLKRQAFESSFFQLLNLHNQIVTTMSGKSASYISQEYLGRACFQAWYEYSKSITYLDKNHCQWNPSGVERYMGLYSSHHGELGHYFRNLYHVIKFISENDALKHEDPNVDYTNRRRYTSLVRATLSQFELALLFYNGLSENGDKFRPLIEKYGLLENFDRDDLYDRKRDEGSMTQKRISDLGVYFSSGTTRQNFLTFYPMQKWQSVIKRNQSEGENRMAKFHERFAIQVPLEQARQRFVARIQNRIFPKDLILHTFYDSACTAVANALGVYNKKNSTAIYDCIGNDFYNCLHAVEAYYTLRVSDHVSNGSHISNMVLQSLAESEMDLGIQWKDGQFQRTGAGVLDRALVNDELRWLSAPKYQRVLDPFEKGLRHLLESGKRPELLFDVITDMYESVEALAKIITDREGKDLSGNAELFVSKIKASTKFKVILKNYIDYANDFRHPPEQGVSRKPISQHEAESFVYLTGLFIRMTQQSQESI